MLYPLGIDPTPFACLGWRQEQTEPVLNVRAVAGVISETPVVPESKWDHRSRPSEDRNSIPGRVDGDPAFAGIDAAIPDIDPISSREIELTPVRALLHDRSNQ